MKRKHPCRTGLSLLLAATLETITVSGQVDISQELETIRTNRCMPGLSALVVKDGRIIAQGAAGYRKEGDPTPLRVTDRINIASCTKWMTATLAARLIDRGVLSWETRIRDVFTNAPSFDPAFADATLEQFLCHRSRLDDKSFNRHQLPLLKKQGSTQELRRWIAETILSEPPAHPSNTCFYSNIGYTVAATMMEIRTGKSWETLMREEVFLPLKMKSATIGIAFDDTSPPTAPVGRLMQQGEKTPSPKQGPDSLQRSHGQATLGPGGFVACTLQDWAAFIDYHVSGTNTVYLRPDTAARLREPFCEKDGDYGRGVRIVPRPWAAPGKALTHNGVYAGESCVFWAAPSKKSFVLVFTNCRDLNASNNSDQALDAVAAFAVRHFFK